jgi:AcrR family transcriptional regulator
MNLEKKHNARKQELMNQVTDIITTEGYANLTVRDICHRLGISTGTFYHYFPEKGDLVWILFSDIDDYFQDKVVSNFVDYEPDNLVVFCNEYGNYVVKGGVETCRYISAAPLKDYRNNYLDENRSIFQILLKIIERGVEKKQFDLDHITTLEAARMLMIILRGYSTDWAKRGGSYDITEAIQLFLQLFRKSLVHEPVNMQ